MQSWPGLISLLLTSNIKQIQVYSMKFANFLAHPTSTGKRLIFSHVKDNCLQSVSHTKLKMFLSYNPNKSFAKVTFWIGCGQLTFFSKKTQDFNNLFKFPC